jgi:hypothetical protein
MSEAYQTRPIRFLELWEHEGWRLKVYGITYGRPTPRAELIQAAKNVVGGTLPRPATTQERPGIGFVGVHDARSACFAFVGWWAELYELNHFLFRAPRERPADLERARSGLVGCTWDLRVVAFEREAWMSALSAKSSPDVEAYLAMRLNEDS